MKSFEKVDMVLKQVWKRLGKTVVSKCLQKIALVAQSFAGGDHWLRQVSMNLGKSGHCMHFIYQSNAKVSTV